MRVSAFAQATAAFALLALSACQDASTVGLGLIDDEASNPNVRVLPATTAEPSSYELFTAGYANSNTQPQSRVLVGSVRDALYGDAEAVAYVDAVAPTSFPKGFADRPITRVTLELRRDYVYGDTTAAFPVELRQVTGAWSPDGLPSDTTLGTGDRLTTATVSAGDKLTVFTLPASWVAANSAALKGSSFGTEFEGFELRAPATPGAGAVLGYDVTFPAKAPTRGASALRVATAQDTVEYRISEVYTRLQRGTPGLAPMGRQLLRAGAGQGLRLRFDYADALRLPLSQAAIRLPLDRSLAGATGTFKRPLAREVALFAKPATGNILNAGILRVGATGDARTSAAAGVVNAFNFNQFVQGILLGRASYDSFEVRFPTLPLSLDVLPVVTDGAVPTAQPRLSLTVVGQ